MQSLDFLVLDIGTQKDFVEHFGARAIPDCPEIRENIMEMMSFAIRNSLTVISTIFSNQGSDYCIKDTNGWSKILDTECENRIMVETNSEVELGKLLTQHQQIIIEHHSQKPTEDTDFIEKLSKLIDIAGKQNLIVLGVPLESYVAKISEYLSEKFTDKKIWILKDAAKGYEEPDPTITKLRQRPNISIMSTRNTIKYLSELSY